MHTSKRRQTTSIILFIILTLSVISSCGNGDRVAPESSASVQTENALIDSHIHLYLEEWNEALETSFIDMHERDNYRWFNICTHGLKWEWLKRQVEISKGVYSRHPEHFSWATSFNLENWGDSGWEKDAIDFIGDSFDNGAVAVKIWKEVGMELKDPDGSYVMIDDPRFTPVLDYIEERGQVLVCHLGEPRNCWLPLEEMTVNGDRNYFKNNPQYHAYKHPEIPSYEEQIAARDRILEQYPKLKVVGCHLGSLEYDTDEIAKRLDAYPNFAVDMAARIIHFKVQDREKVRKFLIDYQDRVLYATDITVRSADGFDDRLGTVSRVHSEDYRYFATDEMIRIDERDEPIQGLNLPDEVLKKLFTENAVKWYGI